MFNLESKQQMVNPGTAYHVSKLLFGGIEVIIPQDEVVSIESVYELKPVIESKRYIGEIYKQKAKVPVYCFSDSMEILTHAPEDRPKCVVIRHIDGDFSVLCHDIQNVVFSDMRLQAVPSCMKKPVMPLTHLCLYKEAGFLKLGLVTNAACLNEYIKNV